MDGIRIGEGKSVRMCQFTKCKCCAKQRATTKQASIIKVNLSVCSRSQKRTSRKREIVACTKTQKEPTASLHLKRHKLIHTQTYFFFLTFLLLLPLPQTQTHTLSSLNRHIKSLSSFVRICLASLNSSATHNPCFSNNCACAPSVIRDGAANTSITPPPPLPPPAPPG